MTKLKKIVITSLIFIIVSIGLALVYNDMVSFDNPKYYKQALEFYDQGDYQNAYYNFSKVKRISPLYKIAIYKQAICADKLRDYPIAIKKYNQFVKKYPKSILTNRANYNLAKAYFHNKQQDKAKEEFEYIKKDCQEEDYVIASSYYLGLLAKQTDIKLAKQYFIDYITLSPKGRFALPCADELAGLKTDFTPAESLLIGQIYFYNQKYNSAEKFLITAPIDKTWSYLTVCYEKEGAYKKAKQTFETGFAKYSKSVDSESLHDAIDSFAAMWQKSPKQGWFYLSKIVQKNKSAGEDYVLFKLARYLDKPYKLALYNRIVYKYPNGDYASESLWNLFWNEYQNKNYKGAKKLGSKHLKDYPDTLANPKMLYWMAKLALKQNKITETNGYLNKILTKYPDDFYAYRADAIMKDTVKNWGLTSHHKIDERAFNVEFPIKYANLDIKDLKLINTLLDLGDYEIWEEINFGNKFVASWFEYKRGHERKATLLARDGLKELDLKPPFNDDVYKLAYPIYWGEDINDVSSRLNIDPYLVISVIREESYFNPLSRSGSGARGLMQLMPSTASYIADKYGIKYHSSKDLYNTKENIELGSNYFKYVKSSLYNNNLLAIAGYNGGPNAVKYWQKTIKYSDLDEFIENIPYPETQNYIKKVYKSYWNYLNIYNY